jgi:hypothetical protein
MPLRSSLASLRPARYVWLALVGALLISSAGALQARPAAAQSTWCWIDPIIEVNGHRINIHVGVAGSEAVVKEHVQHARYRIYVPRGSQYRLIATTSTLFTETVEFVEVDRLSQVGVRVDFTATKNLPAMMVIESGSHSVSVNGSTRAGLSAFVGTLP